MGNHLTRGTAEEQRALRAAADAAGHPLDRLAVVAIVAQLHAAGERILPMTEPPAEGDT